MSPTANARPDRIVVVDDDAEHIGRCAVRTQEHEVVELGILHSHRALYAVLDCDFAGLRCLQADDIGQIRRVRAVAPAAIIAHRLFGGSLGRAHFLKLLRCCVTAIGMAVCEQCVGDFGVARRTAELIDFGPVPIEAKPAHPVQDRLDRRVSRPRTVGILDAQQEGAAVVTGIEPVEQRRARAADVQKPGG